MYKEFETKTSYKYLQEVINALEEPICRYPRQVVE